MASGKSPTKAGMPGGARLRPAGRPRPARQRGTRLDQLAAQLRMIRSAVAVSVAALKSQNCDLDEDIANVLQRCVADRIQDQIDRLESGSHRL